MGERIRGYILEIDSGGLIGLNRFAYWITDGYLRDWSLQKISQSVAKRLSLDKTDHCVTEPVERFIKQLEVNSLTKDRIRLIPRRGRYQIFNAQLDLSWQCNLECRHCYLGDKQLIAEPLGYEEWQSVIVQLHKMAVPKLTLLGGEPILAKHFYRVAVFARSLGFKLFTTTNGVAVNSKVAQSIRNSGFTEIDVSLDGASSGAHEFLRGKGTMKKTIAGIKNLVQAGLEVKTATVLYRANYEEIGRMLEEGRKLGISQMYFNPLLPGQSGDNFWREHHLSFSQWRKAKNTVARWNKEGKSPGAYAESFFDFDDGEMSCVPEYTGCKAGKREIIITPDGYVAACPVVSTDRRFQVSSVRELSLAAIWKHDPWLKKLRMIGPEKMKGKCRSCRTLDRCYGGCHFLAFFLTGDFCNPDPRCPVVIERGSLSPTKRRKGGDEHEKGR